VAKQRRGLDFYREIGQRGGKATRREHGVEHYAHIGRLGGRTPRRSSAPTTGQPRGAGQSAR
jgi:general stress protein YciG